MGKREDWKKTETTKGLVEVARDGVGVIMMIAASAKLEDGTEVRLVVQTEGLVISFDGRVKVTLPGEDLIDLAKAALVEAGYDWERDVVAKKKKWGSL